MATVEERLTALEQENVALKKSDELQTIALRALVTKDAFEALRDTNNKIFDVLMSHNQLTNERLGDLQTQVIELDGKIVGLQTEMRQHFEQQDGKIVGLQTDMHQRFEQQQTVIDARFEQQDGKIVGLQTEMRQRFEQQQTAIDARFEQQQTAIDARFEQQDKHIAGVRGELTIQGQKLDQMLNLLTALGPKPDQG